MFCSDLDCSSYLYTELWDISFVVSAVNLEREIYQKLHLERLDFSPTLKGTSVLTREGRLMLFSVLIMSFIMGRGRKRARQSTCAHLSFLSAGQMCNKAANASREKTFKTFRRILMYTHTSRPNCRHSLAMFMSFI